MIDLTHFQIIPWLQSKHVPYAHSGKNISRSEDWIGINCPFCPTPDPSQHLGINTWTKAIKCWRCGVKGTIIKLVMKMERVSYDNAESSISRFSHKTELNRYQHKQIEKIEFKYPTGMTNELLPWHREYLEQRGFDANLIKEKYRVKSIGPVSEPHMPNRILIPYIYMNQIVTYTARDITGLHEDRYRSCPSHISQIVIDHLLYNIDTVRDIAVVVEGPTDVWRMGNAFVAMGSLVWNSERAALLRGCKQVFVWPDAGTQAKNEWDKLAHSLSSFVPDVRFIEIDEGDPGELDDVTARNFRREILGRKY